MSPETTANASPLARFVRAIPKVELHVHLEGAMRPSTLLDLARKNRVPLPADNVEALRDWFRFRDFDQFVEVYLACSKALQRPEDFQHLIDDFAADQERENVRYSEVHFTVGTHWLWGLRIDEILDAMAETIRKVERERGIVLRLIPDIVRDVGNRTADPTLDWALAGLKREVVVALGLTGREAIYPSAPYADHFATARNGGDGSHRGAGGIYRRLGRLQRGTQLLRCLLHPSTPPASDRGARVGLRDHVYRHEEIFGGVSHTGFCRCTAQDHSNPRAQVEGRQKHHSASAGPRGSYRQ